MKLKEVSAFSFCSVSLLLMIYCLVPCTLLFDMYHYGMWTMLLNFFACILMCSLTCVFVLTCAHTHARTHMCMHSRVHTHTHTHTPSHSFTCVLAHKICVKTCTKITLLILLQPFCVSVASQSAVCPSLAFSSLWLPHKGIPQLFFF